MKAYTFILVLLLGGCTCFNTKTSFPAHFLVTGTGMNDEFLIASPEIPRLKNRALLGSMTAAAKLFRYYEFTTDNFEQKIYWAEIGTEICECRAGMEYMSLLMEHYEEDNVHLLRAKYWAELAIKNGSLQAKFTMRDITEDLLDPKVKAVPVTALTKEALLGSIKAALMSANNEANKNDRKKELYWVRIAVQNGDKQSIPRLARLMQQDGDPDNQLRAQFWFNKRN